MEARRDEKRITHWLRLTFQRFRVALLAAWHPLRSAITKSTACSTSLRVREDVDRSFQIAVTSSTYNKWHNTRNENAERSGREQVGWTRICGQSQDEGRNKRGEHFASTTKTYYPPPNRSPGNVRRGTRFSSGHGAPGLFSSFSPPFGRVCTTGYRVLSTHKRPDEERIGTRTTTAPTAAAVSEQLNTRGAKQPPLPRTRRDSANRSGARGEGIGAAHRAHSAPNSGKFSNAVTGREFYSRSRWRYCARVWDEISKSILSVIMKAV